MENDPLYSYQVVVACKVIIVKDSSILFTREPKENVWMPGRWGLPGGKFLINEGVQEGTIRKIKNEAGVKTKILGLFKIIDILMPQKTVYHFVFVADYISGTLSTSKTYSDGLRWIPFEEALHLRKDELTEYYYPKIIKEFIEDPKKYVPLSFIEELKSFEDKNIQKWMLSGQKK